MGLHWKYRKMVRTNQHCKKLEDPFGGLSTLWQCVWKPWQVVDQGLPWMKEINAQFPMGDIPNKLQLKLNWREHITKTKIESKTRTRKEKRRIWNTKRKALHAKSKKRRETHQNSTKTHEQSVDENPENPWETEREREEKGGKSRDLGHLWRRIVKRFEKRLEGMDRRGGRCLYMKFGKSEIVKLLHAHGFSFGNCSKSLLYFPVFWREKVLFFLFACIWVMIWFVFSLFWAGLLKRWNFFPIIGLAYKLG